MYKLLALALTVTLFFGGFYVKGRTDGYAKEHVKTLAYERMASRNYDTAMAWKARSEATDKMLLGERKDHLTKLDSASRDCNARVARARADGRAALALMSRPVKVDAKGCPDPALWTKTDLQPSLGGWK